MAQSEGETNISKSTNTTEVCVSSAPTSITEMQITSAAMHDCTALALAANAFLDLPGFNGGAFFELFGVILSDFAPERFVSHGLALGIFKNCRAVLLLLSKGEKKNIHPGAQMAGKQQKRVRMFISLETLSIRKLRGKGGNQKQNIQKHRSEKCPKRQRKEKTTPLIDELSGNYRCHFQGDETHFTTTKAVKKGRPGLGRV